MKLRIPLTIFGETSWFAPVSDTHVVFELPRWTEESEPMTFEDFVDTFGECPAGDNMAVKDFFVTGQ